MSRQYDAKQAVLKAYPENRQAGVDLFLDFLNVSEDDFRYEEGETPEEYIYGRLKQTDEGVDDRDEAYVKYGLREEDLP